jgi:pyridoxine 5-phosphate synthase
MVFLGVNVDHVATVRQARLGMEPDPIYAAFLAESGGADGITIHLREDRRHIQDRDLEVLSKTIKTRINLEMACTEEMINIALQYKPFTCCLVPEKRQELTTEGGLNVVKNFDVLKNAVKVLHDNNIMVSLFIDPEKEQIEASARTGADYIEIHTGKYADANFREKEIELQRIYEGGRLANDLGLIVNAGHGLDYKNIIPILAMKELHEVNIGHSIIAKSIYVGIENAVREMKNIIDKFSV